MRKFNCPKCNQTDPAMFYANQRNASYCKRCHKDAVYRMRLRKMGLTPEDQARIANEQGNKCAICHQQAKLTGRDLHQDHSHATNKPRGLLCGRCNQVLGWAHDDPQRLRDAADYLERYK